MGSRARPLPTASRVSAARRSTSWSSVVDAGRHDLLELGIADRRQVHEHVGGGAMRGRLAEERGDVEVARGVDVAPAGQRLRRGDQVDAGLDAEERDLAGVAGGGLERVSPGRALFVRVARQLHGRGVARVRGRIVVGEREELIRQRTARLVGPGQEVGVLRVPRATHRERGDHRDERRAEARRHRRGAAPAWHRRGRAEFGDEPVEGQVAESRDGWLHRTDCTVATRVQ